MTTLIETDTRPVDMKGLPFEWDGIFLRAGGSSARLTPSEAALFEGMMRAHPRVASKGYLLDYVYGLENEEPSHKVIDVMLCMIRKKLREAQLNLYIESFPGRGWRLTQENPHEA